ncbi:MAG: YidC/Oxa1 family membrane protein insertase [Clostridiales bacterium]|nr:YidC/Oxa1 family membrane protein insertase [Clostridiales bacterium]
MNAIYDILGVPFGFVLKLIFNLVNNYGLSLILFTFFARLLMFPSSVSQQKGAAKTQRLQPKLRKIQEKYKGNNQKIQEETQALYQREGHNPMNAGCAPMLVQMPIIFGLIGVIYNPLKYALEIPQEHIDTLVAAVKELLPELTKNSRTIQLTVINQIGELSGLIPDQVYSKIVDFNFTFLGLPLGETPDMKNFSILWIIPILSGLTSFASSIYTYLKQKQSNPEMYKNPTMGCMTFGMPLFSTYFTFLFPVGIGIYWTASNIFAFAQTLILNYTHNPKKMIAKLMIEETIERRSREENLKHAATLRNK